MTALAAAWKAWAGTVADGRPARVMERPARSHPPESLPDRTRPEFWSAAIATSTLWVMLFVYAAVQGFGR